MIIDNNFSHRFRTAREPRLPAPRKMLRKNARDEACAAAWERRESSPEIMLGFCLLAWLIVAGFTTVFILLLY